MDHGDIGIILTIVGIGLTIGFAIIGTLGKQQFNKLNTKIDNKFNELNTKIDNEFNKLDTKIDGVEMRLENHLSQIDNNMKLFHEENAMKIEGLDNSINHRIKTLWNLIRARGVPSVPQEGEYSFDLFEPPRDN